MKNFKRITIVSSLLLTMLLLGPHTALAADKADKGDKAENKKISNDQLMPRGWYRYGKHDEQYMRHRALLNTPAPLYDLSHWMNGSYTPEDLKGKIVVLDFWGTWCGPCIAAIPHNNKVWKKYADRGVVFIGVCSTVTGQERMPEVVEKQGIQYPVARDAHLRMADAWTIFWWPTYYLIDRHGNIRSVGLKPQRVDDALDLLLQEQPAEKDQDQASEDAGSADAKG